MEEFRVPVKTGEIAALGSGTPGDPVILYIHGNLGSRLWFRDVLDVPGYRTLAPDMPNFGDSTASGDFSMAGYAEAMEGFLEAVGVGTATVVGHSLGGVVAMEMAARDTAGLIERLLLVSPGPIEGLVTPREHYPLIETWKTDRELLKTALGTVVPWLESEALLDELVDEGMKMHEGAFTGHPDELALADFRSRLGILNYPTLLIRGESDILISREMCERTASHLGATCLEMPGVGHSPMVENPLKFLEYLKGFLEIQDGS